MAKKNIEKDVEVVAEAIIADEVVEIVETVVEPVEVIVEPVEEEECIPDVMAECPCDTFTIVRNRLGKIKVCTNCGAVVK